MSVKLKKNPFKIFDEIEIEWKIFIDENTCFPSISTEKKTEPKLTIVYDV